MYYNKSMSVLKENSDIFRTGLFGLEKENLRVDINGMLSQEDHPVKMTDPYKEQIVKDFGESQVEFITRPLQSIPEMYKELIMLQDHFLETYPVRLWPFSMPCSIEEELINIAKYDDSIEGRENHIYREGLANRHGKQMQLISGIHYNFSFSEEVVSLFDNGNMEKSRNDIYFHVARNVIRNQWMMTYLYGASPLIDASYEKSITHQLIEVEHCCEELEKAHTYYGVHATSLRMSQYGYHCSNQEKLKMSYDTLDKYVSSIKKGMTMKVDAYEKIGLEKDGKLIQLNTNLLQRESEYYAPIRFKQTKQTGESKIDYLISHGVAYIELRLFDLNPYELYGVSEDQLYLTHLFILDNLFQESYFIKQGEKEEIYANNQKICLFGRNKDLLVNIKGEKILIKNQVLEWLERLEEIAIVLDKEQQGPYYRSVQKAIKDVENDKTISKRIVDEITTCRLTFIQQGLKYAVSGKGVDL